MHICEIPVNAPKQRVWWTCEGCGQLWRRTDGQWKLTPRDEHADVGALR